MALSLQDGIEELRDQYAKRILDTDPGPDRLLAEQALEREVAEQTRLLESVLSKPLTDKAYRLSIKIPNDSEYWNQTFNSTFLSETFLKERWLSAAGRIYVKKTIREERRKNVEWWVRVTAPVLAALISILGLVVALVSISRK